MSTSIHIVGIKQADEKWKLMKNIYEACEKADVNLPDEVDEYFQGEIPDEAGVRVEIEPSYDTRDDNYEPNEFGVAHYKGDYSRGFEVDITKLPKDVTKLRFYNSY